MFITRTPTNEEQDEEDDVITRCSDELVIYIYLSQSDIAVWLDVLQRSVDALRR